MKILSIGNSFSQDAHKWLHQVAQSCGDEIYAANLYIGGCTLYQHWQNYESGAAEYDYEINGGYIRKISINEALTKEKWDVVTFQQASHLGGIWGTFVPYLENLAAAVRAACPDARFYFYGTWAYESDSKRSQFAIYNYDQRLMDERLAECQQKAAELLGAPIIPVGKVIKYLRENVPEFDYQNGGMSLNRDGFHLSYGCGRYAAALTWYGVLFDKSVTRVSFRPPCDETDEWTADKIRIAVDTVLGK